MAVAHEKQGCRNRAEFLIGLLEAKKSAFPEKIVWKCLAAKLLRASELGLLERAAGNRALQ